MRLRSWSVLLAALAASVMLAACGGGGSSSNTPPPPPITVTVTPATATVNAGLSTQFTATVANTSNTAVTWAVTGGAANGTISANGLYTAPATPPAGAVTITATSQADSTASGSAAVTVLPAVTVSITPASATVNAGETQQFTATVANTSDTTVAWAVTGGAANGTITGSGLYTAPATAPGGAVTVTATAQADAKAIGSAQVTVAPAVTVVVAPATVSVNVGLTQQFSATVNNTTDQTVTWAVSGGGTISATGLYTPPATPPSGAVTVTATAQADSTKSGTAAVTVLPAISVTVTPATASVNAKLTQQFQATVNNNSDQTVAWAVTGGAANGTITASGLYTAPATPPSGAVTITATSQADASKSGTATVTVLSAVAVTVNPAAAQVYANQTQQFTAAVANTSDASVTWAVTGGASNGTITQAGLYTAPATPPSGAVTVTATSQLDPTAAGSAQVTVEPAISVTVSAASATVNAGLTDQFSATVGPAGISQNVTWQVNGVTGGDATNGTINSSGLYQAPSAPPSGGTVQITATSATDSVVSAPYTLTIAPAVTVSITAQGTPPSVLVAGTSETFAATVGNNSNQNVTWEVNGIANGNSTVGTITSGGVYTAPRLLPQGGGVEITAVAQADASAVSNTIPITDGWANESLKGNYVFAVQGVSEAGCAFAEIGQFTADGTDSSGPQSNAGNITGEADLNAMASSSGCAARFTGAVAGNVTGTYVILPDGRGGIQFATAPEGTNLVFAITLDANGNGRLIEQDTNSAVTGSVWAQTSTGALSGDYVYGEPHEIGRINAAAGVWTGTEDNNIAGTFHQDVGVSGTYGAPDTTYGRSTMSLTATGGAAENYVFYTISSSRIELMRSDAGTLALGRADAQDNATFNLAAFTGGYVFQNSGVQAAPAGEVQANGGQITADGQGGITFAVKDERIGTGSEPSQTYTSTTASYTADPSGDGEYRVTMSPYTYAVWMYSASGGEMLEVDSIADVQGTVQQQQNGPFTANALFGEYALQLNGSPDGTKAVIVQGEIGAEGGQLAGLGDSMINGAVNPAGTSLFLIGSYTTGANASAGEMTGTLIGCSGTTIPTVDNACPTGDTQVFSATLDFWMGAASESSTGAASGRAFITDASGTGYWQGTLTQQY